MVGGRRGGILQDLIFPIIFWVMKPGSTEGSGGGEGGEWRGALCGKTLQSAIDSSSNP